MPTAIRYLLLGVKLLSNNFNAAEPMGVCAPRRTPGRRAYTPEWSYNLSRAFLARDTPLLVTTP